jgi:hypothetical protein
LAFLAGHLWGAPDSIPRALALLVLMFGPQVVAFWSDVFARHWSVLIVAADGQLPRGSTPRRGLEMDCHYSLYKLQEFLVAVA